MTAFTWSVMSAQATPSAKTPLAQSGAIQRTGKARLTDLSERDGRPLSGPHLRQTPTVSTASLPPPHRCAIGEGNHLSRHRPCRRPDRLPREVLEEAGDAAILELEYDRRSLQRSPGIQLARSPSRPSPRGRKLSVKRRGPAPGLGAGPRCERHRRGAATLKVYGSGCLLLLALLHGRTELLPGSA
jgi:hypothetical protein